MSLLPLPPDAFVQDIRNVLLHLYDNAYLQSHTLAAQPTVEGKWPTLTRAQALRRTLLECIETLKPERQAVDTEASARSYAILIYKYVDGLPIEEVADKLGLSRRHAYREHARAVEALAGLVWDELKPRGYGEDAAEAGPGDVDRLSVAQAEVARLSQSGTSQSLAVSDVLQSVFELLSPRLAKASIRLAKTGIRQQGHVEPGASLFVMADRAVLRQALLSLLSRGLHERTEGELSVDVSRIDDRVTLRFCIQGHSATPDASPNAPQQEGVDLVIVEGLISGQGGTVAIERTVEAWQADVTLPAAGGRPVLVIDDNADLVALFQRYASSYPVSLIGATNADQAFRLVKDVGPQLILLDLMMPNQDGWDILRQLRSLPETRTTPIVICSVLNEVDLARAMGASDYLTKPVNQAELIGVLRRWLGTLHPAV